MPIDGLTAQLVSEPLQVTDPAYVEVYGARLELRTGEDERVVALVATGMEVMTAGLAMHPTDRDAWQRYADRAREYVASTFDALADVPGELRLGALLKSR